MNVNTDTQTALLRENGITSVPTVKVYRKGSVVESIHGAQSAASLRAVLDKHIPAPLDGAIGQALQLYKAGQLDDAPGQGEFLRSIEKHEGEEEFIPCDHEGIEGNPCQGRR